MLLRLGRSKMEKLQDQFVMTHKETGKEIIMKHGPDAFAMWWYIEGLCYGKEKVMAFPKKETISEDLGISESTVQRWIRKLEKVKAIKRVKLFRDNGAQTSNLLIVNASFPEIPEGWNLLYEHGIYQPRYMEYIPLENAEDKPWSYLHTAPEQEIDVVECQKTQENSPSHICTGHEIALVTPDQGGCADLTRGGEVTNPDIPRDEGTFFEREEENLNKNLFIYKENTINENFEFYNWLNPTREE